MRYSVCPKQFCSFSVAVSLNVIGCLSILGCSDWSKVKPEKACFLVIG
uniref:Lipoprotein n=1 Tax=Anguilla anguilla TaxID=7936 RepID=A0A0E9WXK8_ANGAN